MRAPEFWNRPASQFSLQSWVLGPLGRIYGALTARRVAQPPEYSANVPVVCIGNINVGGTGKTPTTIALAQDLIDRGYDVHIVSRGYGGTFKGTFEVEPAYHSAKLVGDEPLLMAAFSRVWVTENRADGVRAAEGAGAHVVLLDDGFQDPSVRKHLSIVVVGAKYGFGNGKCLPAGPLREPVHAGLRRADIILSIGDKTDQQKFQSMTTLPPALLHLIGELAPLETGMDWRDGPYIAFAGIGDPEKFFQTLRSLGAELLRTEALDDHQTLTPTLIKRLLSEARQAGAQLVTTEKDAVRLPPEFRGDVIALPVRLSIENFDALLDQLLPLLPKR